MHAFIYMQHLSLDCVAGDNYFYLGIKLGFFLLVLIYARFNLVYNLVLSCLLKNISPEKGNYVPLVGTIPIYADVNE